MLNDREQQTLNDLEHQLLIEDPVLVQQFKNIAPREIMTRTPGRGKDGRPSQSERHLPTMLLVVSALFMAFSALRGSTGAVIGVALLVAAVAWSRHWTRLAVNEDRRGG
jgi:hypothetical protein